MDLIDRFSRRIKLTDERWNHIAETYPELKDIYEGKHMCVVVRLDEETI